MVTEKSDLTETVEAPEAGDEPVFKKKGKKKWAIAGTVLVIAVVSAVGMFVWHEQPSFCGTVCHQPMGSYVDSLTDETKTVSTHYKAGSDCLSCHETTLSEQLSEGVKFVTGDYTIPLEDSFIGTSEFCLGSGCHGTYEDLAEKTKGYDQLYNPHDSHYEELDCNKCHSMHDTSEYYCTSCHAGIKVPEGWDAASMY